MTNQALLFQNDDYTIHIYSYKSYLRYYPIGKEYFASKDIQNIFTINKIRCKGKVINQPTQTYQPTNINNSFK